MRELLVLCAGCSVAFGVRRPASEPEHCGAKILLPVGDTAAGLLVGGFSVLAFASVAPNSNPDHSAQQLGALGLVAGSVALLASAAYGYKACGDHPPPPTVGERDERSAAQLAREAREAAKAGDCVRARALADQVRLLDPELHERALTNNAEMASCR